MQRGIPAVLWGGLIDGRGVLSVLVFVAVIVGGAIGLSFDLEGNKVHYPATWAGLTGSLVIKLSRPVLNRWLRRIMLSNRAGLAR